MAMDKLISAVGGGIGAALTSDPTDTSNAAKGTAAVSAAETDVEVEDTKAQGQRDRATGGVTPPTPTGQMIPYSPGDAAGNPNFAMASGMSSAEIVDGIRTGEPVALEQFYITQDDMGRSIVKFRDDSGQEQQWVVSAATALGMMDTRRENRHKMAEFNAQQLELQQAREENQGAFEWGMKELDDGTNPLYMAMMRDQFKADPKGTIGAMYEILQLQKIDAEAAELAKHTFANQGLHEKSGEAVKDYHAILNFEASSWDQTASTYEEKRLAKQRFTDMDRMVDDTSPSPDMDLTQSPAENWGDATAGSKYLQWMKQLETGIPLGSGRYLHMAIPHPDNRDFNAKFPEFFAKLQQISQLMGWQMPFAEQDLQAISSALMDHHRLSGSDPELNRGGLVSPEQLNILPRQGSDQIQPGVRGGAPGAPGGPPQSTGPVRPVEDVEEKLFDQEEARETYASQDAAIDREEKLVGIEKTKIDIKNIEQDIRDAQRTGTTGEMSDEELRDMLTLLTSEDVNQMRGKDNKLPKNIIKSREIVGDMILDRLEKSIEAKEWNDVNKNMLFLLEPVPAPSGANWAESDTSDYMFTTDQLDKLTKAIRNGSISDKEIKVFFRSWMGDSETGTWPETEEARDRWFEWEYKNMIWMTDYVWGNREEEEDAD